MSYILPESWGWFGLGWGEVGEYLRGWEETTNQRAATIEQFTLQGMVVMYTSLRYSLMLRDRDKTVNTSYLVLPEKDDFPR